MRIGRTGDGVSDVIVIGGGVVGASAAYHLARVGASVTLVDREDQGQATAAGAGICSPSNVLDAPAAYYPLAVRSGKYYDELLAHLAEDGERATGYDVTGMLRIARSAEEAVQLPDVMRALRDARAQGASHIGDTALLNPSAVAALFPPLGPVHGAVYSSGGARVDGRLLRDALRRAAARHGARLMHASAALDVRGRRVHGVVVDGENLSADGVLIAGGAWSAGLTEILGIVLPVSPIRDQIAHLSLPGTDTSGWPVVTGFHAHYLLGFPHGRVVAGATREDAGFDYQTTAAGVHEVLGEALRIAPGLATATLAEIRIGMRPATPDNLPVLGALPGLSNTYIAAGHGAYGLQLGPYSAALVADQMRGIAPPLDMTPYAPERYSAVG